MKEGGLRGCVLRISTARIWVIVSKLTLVYSNTKLAVFSVKY
jgi:hypothetical protein